MNQRCVVGEEVNASTGDNDGIGDNAGVTVVVFGMF